MRNFDDSFMPQRFRMPEKDTRKFYEKPEWWIEFVKWGIIVVLLLGAIGVGATFAMNWWNKRQQRLEEAAQEARLREIEESKEREAKAAAQKAEREAREKARAAAKAEKERIRQEKLAAEEQRKAEREQKQKELESRETGPRRVRDLEKQQQTAGVRWWGKGVPPKFADRKEGDVFWCLFPGDREDVMIRVKVGPDKTPAAVDLADGKGYMRPYERELLEDAMKQRPHVIMMDRAAWACPPEHLLKKAAHMKVPDRSSFRPAEEILGKETYQFIRSTFHSDDRLDKLNCVVEFHWQNESHEPIKWELKYDEMLGGMKLRRAIEDILQAELDAANGVADKSSQKAAEVKPEKKRSSLTMNTSSFSGGPSRSGRKLGENYGPQFSSGSGRRMQDSEASRREEARKTRITNEDIQCVIDAGYLSSSFAE